MTDAEFTTRLEALQTLIYEEAHIRGRGFSAQVKRAGRLFPKRIRASATVIQNAQNKITHPRLSQQIDTLALIRAFDTVEAYVRNTDWADRRKGFWLSLAAILAFYLLVIVVLVIGVMVWRGFV